MPRIAVMTVEELIKAQDIGLVHEEPQLCDPEPETLRSADLEYAPKDDWAYDDDSTYDWFLIAP